MREGETDTDGTIRTVWTKTWMDGRKRERKRDT